MTMPAESRRHRRDPNERELAGLIASARSSLDDLEFGIMIDHKRRKRSSLTSAELLRRARRGTRDGYPSSSGLRAAGGPVSMLDENDVPMPPVSDPVGELAVGDPVSDPVRRAAATVVHGLTDAANQLSKAVSALAKAAPPPVQDTDPNCVVHAQVLDVDPVTGGPRPRWVPVEEGRTRCSWCHDFWLTYSQDAPPELVRLHDEGRRMTPGLVAEHLGKVQKVTNKRRHHGGRR